MMEVAELQPSSGEPRLIQLGELFSSIEDFKLRLDEHKLASQSNFWMRDCRTLNTAASSITRARDADPKLKYYFARLTCTFGGVAFCSKSKKKRKSIKQGCPAFIHIQLSQDAKSLFVKDICVEHNHSLESVTVRKADETNSKIREQEVKLGLPFFFKKTIVHNGYLYRIVQAAAKQIRSEYLVCQKEGCPGRAVKERGDIVISVTKKHDHQPDHLALERMQFRSKLIERAEQEVTPFQQIYDEECPNFPNVFDKEPLDEILQLMTDYHDRAIPRLPRNILDMSLTLSSDQWCNRFCRNLEESPSEIFIGMVKGRAGEACAVFASIVLCQAMNKAGVEIHIDTSYKSLPAKPADFKYFLTIHFIEDKHSFCAAYAMMSSCNKAACLAVLTYLQDELLRDCKPSLILVSVEQDLMLACQEVFHNVKVQYSMVHFIRNIWEKCLQLEFPQAWSDFEECQKIIHYLMVLPLLPPTLIESGFNNILLLRNFFEFEGKESLQVLVQYVGTKWLSAVEADKISTAGSLKRSSQNVLYFHQEMDKLLFKSNITIWRFIEMLQQVEQSHRVDYERLQKNEELATNRLLTYALENPTVVQACEDLENGKLDVLEFLRKVSCTVQDLKLTLKNYQRINLEPEVSGEEEETEMDTD